MAAAIGSSMMSASRAPARCADVLDGAPLHLGDAGGHADDHARMLPRPALVGLLDEVAEHRLGDFEVGDDAVLERAGWPRWCRACARPCASRRRRRRGPRRSRGRWRRPRVPRAGRPTLDVHERIGGAQVDPQVAAQPGEQPRSQRRARRASLRFPEHRPAPFPAVMSSLAAASSSARAAQRQPDRR